MGFDELDAIAEGIGSEGPIKTRNGLRIVLYLATRGRQRLEKCRQITDQKCRMRFPGRAKIGLDAEVQLQEATLEPGTATRSEIRRLGNFGQPKKLAIEPAHQRFTPSRHGQLNVIDAVNGHGARA